MITTRAAITDKVGASPELRDITVADPRDNEILVQILASGICHTDLAVIHGDMPSRFPIVLGHEGAGVVEAVGPNISSLAPGDRVVLSYSSCGHCAACLDGAPAYCAMLGELNLAGTRLDGTSPLADSDGQMIHGSFFGQSSWATHVITQSRNIVKIPPDFPLELAAPLGCGVQTGAGAVFNTLRPAPGSRLVVAGAGTVGLSAIMAAAALGVTTVVAIDLLPERRAAALRLGASVALDGRSPTLGTELRSALNGLADATIDTTAVPPVLTAAAAATRRGGTVVSLGVPRPGAQLPVAALMGKTFKGVMEGDAVPQRFIPQLTELIRAGRFPVDQLVTAYPFEQISEAIDATVSGAAIKAVLTFPDRTGVDG